MTLWVVALASGSDGSGNDCSSDSGGDVMMAVKGDDCSYDCFRGKIVGLVTRWNVYNSDSREADDCKMITAMMRTVGVTAEGADCRGACCSDDGYKCSDDSGDDWWGRHGCRGGSGGSNDLGDAR